MDNQSTQSSPTAMNAKLRFTGNALVVRKKLTFGEYVQTLSALVAQAGGSPWWVGDLLVHAERVFEERYADAVSLELGKMFGVSVDTILQYQWRSDHVAMKTRVQGLSWSHHRVVAKLDMRSQRAMLAKALDEGWTVGRLGAELKDDKRGRSALWLLVSCKSEVDRGELRVQMTADGRETRDKTVKGPKRGKGTPTKRAKRTKSPKGPRLVKGKAKATT